MPEMQSEELAAAVLSKHFGFDVTKIPEGAKKSADFLVEVEGFRCLVEVKEKRPNRALVLKRGESFEAGEVYGEGTRLTRQADITKTTSNAKKQLRENIAHYKWIDATIAAELAVKEVLATVNPELETLLMEMPSPPLAKLYGTILERYLGEKSPYLKQIQKGVEIRNRLVHRHDAEAIDDQEASDYVQSIEGAIFHLLSLAHPNSLLITSARSHVYR